MAAIEQIGGGLDQAMARRSLWDGFPFPVRVLNAEAAADARAALDAVKHNWLDAGRM